MNVFNSDKSRLSPQELAMSSNTIIRQKYRKDFTLEFSRDRKSMSSHVTTAAKAPGSSGQPSAKMFVKGAPESVVERCTHIRVGTQKVPMTPQIKQEIMKLVHQYGTGRDTLRCLALGTIDNPLRREDMDLEDARKFVSYEVNIKYEVFQNRKHIYYCFRIILPLLVLWVCLIRHVQKSLMLLLDVVMLVFVLL